MQIQRRPDRCLYLSRALRVQQAGIWAPTISTVPFRAPPIWACPYLNQILFGPPPIWARSVFPKKKFRSPADMGPGRFLRDAVNLKLRGDVFACGQPESVVLISCLCNLKRRPTRRGEFEWTFGPSGQRRPRGFVWKFGPSGRPNFHPHV